MARKKAVIDVIRGVKLHRKNIFDEFIQDIDPDDIPAKYISYVKIQFKNGMELDLTGEELDVFPCVEIKNENDKRKQEEFYKTIKDVKIFVKTNKIKREVTRLHKKLFEKYYKSLAKNTKS